MADILLFHHIQGLTEGLRGIAANLRQAGHTVHTPDLFDGQTFASIDDGFAYAQDVGFEALRARGASAAEPLSREIVYMGFSFGVVIAQQLAQTRAGARGAVLLHSCVPVTEFSQEWPGGVPVQIHGMAGDEFFSEDLPAAQDLSASADDAELFIYPGGQHLFTDSSLEAYDEAAAAQVFERVAAFLSRV